MDDPLAALAEREVPERTNYFNPDDAQTIISRYSNTRRNLADVSGTLDRVSKVQDDEEARARQQVTWDRADEEYADRQNAKRLRGDFIRGMQQIDPTSPDYTKQVVDFKSGLPPELADDDTINSILVSMNAEADDARRRRDTEVSKKQTFDNQLAMFRERSKYNSALKGITDEDVKSATMPDGTIDLLSLGMKAAARERGYKEGEFDRRLKAVNEGRVQVVKDIDLSRRGRERRGAVGKFIVEDRAAFPPRFENEVLNEYRKSKGLAADAEVKILPPDWEDKVTAARKKDAAPLENELSAAFAYDDPDDYVNLIDGLSDTQKERRRMVWEHAHKDGAVEEMDAPDAPTGAKPLTDAAVASDYLKRAGGDKAKAREMARTDGYTF